MTTDTFFEQGDHVVCEDYAVHGDDHVIVCDGCSNGGGPRIDTDFGARFIAKAAQSYINLLKNGTHADFIVKVGEVALRGQQAVPGISRDCLSATLLAAVDSGDAVNVLALGDGVWGGRRRDGVWEVSVLEFLKGAPFYLRYLLFDGQKDDYFQRFGGEFRRRTLRGPLNEPAWEEWESCIDPQKPWFRHSFRKSDYDLVFVGSDGLESFTQTIMTETSKVCEPVPLHQVLHVLLDIPVFSPGFLQRQGRWAFWRNLDGTFLRRGWHNKDDVSLGVIHLG